MRIAVGNVRELTEETIAFARQLGCTSITLNTPPLTGRPSFGSNAMGQTYWVEPGDEKPPVKWDFLELLHLRMRIEAAGLKLEAIENVPFYFYKKIVLGQPGYEEQLENYCETVRNMGRAGIPVLGYHFMGNRVWRTSKGEHARGDALTSSFDLDLAVDAPPTDGAIVGEDQMWENYERFITTVLPVAEEAGVTLSLHPDDPPVPSLGGVARIFRSLSAFKHALDDLGNSPNHKVTFCMGTFAELGVDEMFEAMDYFAANKRIAYVHFRNVKGTIPKFSESFVDEGDVDCVAAIERLKRQEFDGFLIDDHVPHMSGDTVYMHRSRAFAIGYMRGLLHAVAGHS
jgi:mannonate dehydratase